MKKPVKYLKFYLECMESNLIPYSGLCRSFSHDDSIELFSPFPGEATTYRHDEIWWGAEVGERERYFNAFRQNVVLFCAAMNNEL